MIEASVVLATYNRADQLRRCLDALARQTQATTDYEVVVVDDGSSDGTAEFLATYRPPFALRVIHQPNAGQCAALNRGVTEAQGRICIFLDDDVVVSPRFVAEHLRPHRERNDVVGIGQMTLTLPAQAGWFARAFGREWREHYAGLNEGREPTWRDCYGGNMSVDRAICLAVGGFDASLRRAYDIELAYRLERHGCSFAYLPEALGDQDDRKALRALIADSGRSGAACVDLYRRYPATLPDLLGGFGEQRLSIAAALRALLVFDLSPERLEPLGWLIAKCGRPDTAYDLLQRYSFWRSVRRALGDDAGWEALTGGTPVLMYHAFAASEEEASRYVIPIHRFEAQMAWLKRRGYRVLSLGEYLHYRREFRLPPHRSVVITIDDGYADALSLAYPVLRHYGYPATVFLSSAMVGRTGPHDGDRALAGRAALTWAEARAMLQGGIEIGAHGRTHPDLTSISLDRAAEEVAGSRKDLERELGGPVEAFSYPYGKHSPAMRSIVRQAGFICGCGTDNGRNTPVTSPYALRRVEIHGTDSLIHFAVALRYGCRPRVLWRLVREALGAKNPTVPVARPAFRMVER